jgi:DNA-binding NarL/FixJ family response regulator
MNGREVWFPLLPAYLNLKKGTLSRAGRLAEKNVVLDYIGQLLKAFRDEQYGMQPEVLSTQTADRPSTINQPLFSALSPRELEIMDMLAQRLHNKEIAAKLFIAPEEHLR